MCACVRPFFLSREWCEWRDCVRVCVVLHQNPVFPNYNAALIAVKNYAEKEAIPYRHILLDSWWYFKGVGNGVKNWTAMPDVFPPGGTQGLADFHAASQWPVVGHNRYWSSNSDYAVSGGLFYFCLAVSGRLVLTQLARLFADPKRRPVPVFQRPRRQDDCAAAARVLGFPHVVVQEVGAHGVRTRRQSRAVPCGGFLLCVHASCTPLMCRSGCTTN